MFQMSKGKGRKSQQNMDLLVGVFENNYAGILAYLPWEEQTTLKLICQGVYYISITNQIWTGLRLEAVDKKMEAFEDIDFVQEEPKIITKQEKQIRIHSLKKNKTGLRIRQASNIKQKKISLNTINNELPFRSTEVGFKRLLKTAVPKPKISSSKEISNFMLDLVQIPKKMTLRDLIIDVKDPWSVNVQRAHALSGIARNWNEFHHRIITELREVEKDFSSLVKKCIKTDKTTTDYLKLFETQPYRTIRQLFDGAQQQLLIDDQLNKLGRLFVKNHKEMTSFGQFLEPFISKTHQTCSKLKRQSNKEASALVIDNLSTVDELVEEWVKIGKECPSLTHYLVKSLLEISDRLLEDISSVELEIAGDSFPLFSININHLSRRPDYFEVLFEVYERVCGGLLKLCEGGSEDNIGLNLTAGKFKNLKAIAHHLWNISKYFSKLTKQLETKQKKGSKGGKAAIILNFMQSYDTYKVQHSLMDWKYPTRAQKQVIQLKQRVNGLKGLMQGE